MLHCDPFLARIVVPPVPIRRDASSLSVAALLRTAAAFS
jgi:hypothetical protein